MKTPHPLLPTLLFQILTNLPTLHTPQYPHPPILVLLLCFFDWWVIEPHLTFLYDIMDLHMPSYRSLVLQRLYIVFYATRPLVPCTSTMHYVPLVLFSSTMIWHHTYKYTHFFQPFPLYGKNLKHPFLENFKNSTPTPHPLPLNLRVKYLTRRLKRLLYYCVML